MTHVEILMRESISACNCLLAGAGWDLTFFLVLSCQDRTTFSNPAPAPSLPHTSRLPTIAGRGEMLGPVIISFFIERPVYYCGIVTPS